MIHNYDPKASSFTKLRQESYGKSGARRRSPGGYLATDFEGRALMIAAMENVKQVYILNRDAACVSASPVAPSILVGILVGCCAASLPDALPSIAPFA